MSTLPSKTSPLGMRIRRTMTVRAWLAAIVACGLILYLSGEIMSQAQTRPKAGIVVLPGARDADPSKPFPFSVSLSKIAGDSKDLWRVDVNGSRSVGTLITAWLEWREGDNRGLTVPISLGERGNGAAGQPIVWNMGGITGDSLTLMGGEICIYLQPNGVPADGGTQYRIPVGRWITDQTAKGK